MSARVLHDDCVNLGNQQPAPLWWQCNVLRCCNPFHLPGWHQCAEASVQRVERATRPDARTEGQAATVGALLCDLHPPEQPQFDSHSRAHRQDICHPVCQAKEELLSPWNPVLQRPRGLAARRLRVPWAHQVAGGTQVGPGVAQGRPAGRGVNMVTEKTCLVCAELARSLKVRAVLSL